MAKEWKSLSNDRIREIGEYCLTKNNGILNWIDFYRAIERDLKIVNLLEETIQEHQELLKELDDQK